MNGDIVIRWFDPTTRKASPGRFERWVAEPMLALLRTSGLILLTSSANGGVHAALLLG